MSLEPQIAPLAIPPLVFSSKFYLGCGTVTVDPKFRKVLVVLDPVDNAYKLPRGRKDWGEPLTATATRETFEETGYHATLLPVPLSTRATQPAPASSDSNHPYYAEAKVARYSADGDVLITNSARLTEPFALTQHYQPNGTLALGLWYVGAGDSTAEAIPDTQMANENYEASWVSYEEAPGLMGDPVYAEIVRAALELAEVAREMDATSVQGVPDV